MYTCTSSPSMSLKDTENKNKEQCLTKIAAMLKTVHKTFVLSRDCIKIVRKIVLFARLFCSQDVFSMLSTGLFARLFQCYSQECFVRKTCVQCYPQDCFIRKICFQCYSQDCFIRKICFNCYSQDCFIRWICWRYSQDRYTCKPQDDKRHMLEPIK